MFSLMPYPSPHLPLFVNVGILMDSPSPLSANIIIECPYSFTNESLRLIESYLTNILQIMKINKNLSKWTKFLHGLPQGSFLNTFPFNNIQIIYFSYIIFQKYVIFQMITRSLPMTKNSDLP